jgi:hypothetical protein
MEMHPSHSTITSIEHGSDWCTCFKHQETCLAGVTHAFVGDGVCNDETNIAECDYDGGYCCPNPNMVGDAICHDETNHLGCNYDGGDCCVNVNTDSCSDCNCLASGVITFTWVVLEIMTTTLT